LSSFSPLSNSAKNDCLPVIKPNEPETDDVDTLELATVHRVKGLEFDQIVSASAKAGLDPLDLALMSKGDEVSREYAETEARCPVYVAITRARKRAFILNYGKESELFTNT
jgi:superfamily I DNA/RNA helicase